MTKHSPLFFAKMDDLKTPERLRSRKPSLSVIPEKLPFSAVYTQVPDWQLKKMPYEPESPLSPILETTSLRRV